jgi:peptidoglycan DL-endopeptidase CwlO
LAPRTVPGLRRAVSAVFVAALAVGVAAFLAPAPAHADPSVGSLAEQVEQQGRELDVVMEQYNQVNVLLTRTQSQLADVQAQIPRLTARMDSAAATVTSVADNAYRGSMVSGVGALLSAGTPGDLIDRLDTLDVLARGAQRDIDTMSAAHSRLRDEQARLDALVAQQTRQQADLAARKAKIQGQIAALQKQQDELKRKQDEQARAAAAAAAAAKKPPPPPPPSGNPAPPAPPTVNGRVGAVLAYAYAQRGKPYSFGASGPNAFDCSGLSMMAWRQAGVHLDHSSYIQMNEQTVRIPVNRMSPGDLVFFEGGGHVGIYIGNGNFIHAPHTGAVVTITALSWEGPITAVGRPR